MERGFASVKSLYAGERTGGGGLLYVERCFASVKSPYAGKGTGGGGGTVYGPVGFAAVKSLFVGKGARGGEECSVWEEVVQK